MVSNENMDNFDTEKLITEIERRPAIWNSSLEEYSNRELKKQCWDEIVEIFGGKGLTPCERKDTELLLQKKWKGIRGCFTREVRRQGRMMAGDKPGPRKSEYTYFQQLQFLRMFATTRDLEQADYIYFDTPHMKQVKTEISEVESNDDNGDYNDDDNANDNNEDFVDEDPLKHVFRRKKRKCDVVNDEDKMFLLSLLSTLQSVPKSRKMSTKIKLMTVLDEATRDLNA